MGNRVSIVTVSKNTGATISNTIESVLIQTYDNIECVFIDGSSTDKTNEVIESYKERLLDRGYGFVHVSEPDKGIYDAMNKGIFLASGEWIYFLNADDRLIDGKVIANVFEKDTDADCIYGNTINVLANKRYLRKGQPLETLYYGSPLCHQALFTKKQILEYYLFDTKWRYLADFDQIVRMYIKGTRFLYKDIIIAEFSLNGVSQQHIIQRMAERESILKHNRVSEKKRLKRYARYVALIIIKSNSFLFRLSVAIREKRQILNHEL